MCPRLSSASIAALCLMSLGLRAVPAHAQTSKSAVDYKVLATSRTSTMEKEMKAAAEAGFRFGGVMGGETAFGGAEVVVVMVRSEATMGRFDYRLLAANRTSTMERELQNAGDAGFEYRGQTVFKSTFGGKEVVVILERDLNAASRKRYEYRLVATTKTSTLEKELSEAGKQGFDFVGITVAETAVGGNENVAILRRAPQ